MNPPDSIQETQCFSMKSDPVLLVAFRGVIDGEARFKKKTFFTGQQPTENSIWRFNCSIELQFRHATISPAAKGGAFKDEVLVKMKH